MEDVGSMAEMLFAEIALETFEMPVTAGDFRVILRRFALADTAN